MSKHSSEVGPDLSYTYPCASQCYSVGSLTLAVRSKKPAVCPNYRK